MKIKLFLLCFFLFQFSNAQNITFSDPVLKDFLLIATTNFNQDPKDFSNDSNPNIPLPFNYFYNIPLILSYINSFFNSAHEYSINLPSLTNLNKSWLDG